ncbi:MAG TPA: amidohydrolase [Micromonosporaceae bacterium]
MADEVGVTMSRRLDELMPDLEAFYRDLHEHPELSFQEVRTAAEVARRLDAFGYQVTTGVGRTGVVGVLRNGDGPTVVLRADMDALPVREETGLDYASRATGVDRYGQQVPVMHACGHDVHVTCLTGAAAVLAEHRDRWRGTLVALFQPAEEVGGGAQSMLDDGLLDLFDRPDVVLGQHVTALPAGTLNYRAGAAMAAADSLRITLHGKGSHGSRPEAGVDPVVMAAALVMRLQTIVSRHVAAGDAAVVTVGSLQAGLKENIIPATAELKLSVRSFDPAVRARVLTAIERMAKAEALAFGAPREPEIEVMESFPATVNDEAATARLVETFGSFFGTAQVREIPPIMGSEDFGVIGTAAKAPSVFWFLGGWDPQAFAAAEAGGTTDQDIPANHSPHFAPLIQPTLTVGVQALVVAALAWLKR